MTSTTLPGNDFLDILFNGRNKEYGAYALRRKYDQRVRNAILGTASIALVVIGGYALNNTLMASVTHTRITMPPVVPITPIEPILPPEKVVTPPPPPAIASTPPPVMASVTFTSPPNITRDDVPEEDEVPPITELEHKAVGLRTSDGPDDGIDPGLVPSVGTGVVEAPVAAVRDDHDEIFRFVEIPPSFPGGEEALARYLGNHLRYPQLASETGVSGTVFVQFVVDYEGNVKDVKPVGARKGAGLEEEATRVIKAMPKWRPGKQNGRAVSVLYNIPVNFHLEN